MCLAALAFNRAARFPLVVVANRDEFHHRETAAMAWWEPQQASAPGLLAGRDLLGGGTWFGINSAGRWALLTNIRSSAPPHPTAPSRGSIVADWLSGRQPIDKFWMRVGMSGYNGFNLLAAELTHPGPSETAAVSWDCHWISSAQALPRRLERGVYGLSNGALDEPWPKVRRLKQALASHIDSGSDRQQLIERLFGSLTDRDIPADHELPSTGVPFETERQLGATFVHMPERGYGTRSSHVLVAERTARGLAVHVHERRFDAHAHLAEHRQACLDGWPLRLPPAAAARSIDAGARWPVHQAPATPQAR